MGKIKLRRLILNTAVADKMPVESALQKRIRNLKSIWYNEKDSDIGIEKLFRLFLAAFSIYMLWVLTSKKLLRAIWYCSSGIVGRLICNIEIYFSNYLVKI